MANPTQFRKYGTKTVPKLLEKVNILDIVDNVQDGGTGVPLSAEQGKVLNSNINTEIANRQQAIIDLIDDADTDYNTLKKLEDKIKENRGYVDSSIAQEQSDRATAIQTEVDRATTAEANLQTTIADNKSAIESALQNEIDRATAKEQTLTDDLASEVSARETAVSNEATSRTNAVAAEKTAREDADTALQTAIDNEKTRAIAKEDDLATAIANEKSRAEGVEGSLSEAINNEKTQRVNADISHEERLSAIESGLVAGLRWKAKLDDMTALDNLVEDEIQPAWAYYVGAEKDVYVCVDTPDGDYQPETWENKSFLKFADFAEVTGLINAEKSRAMTKEAALDGDILNEVSRAQTAEQTLTTNLQSEVDRATNAEQTLQNNIDAEATARTDAVNAEKSRAENEEQRIEAKLDQEISDRTDAVTTEKNRAIAAEDTLTANLNQEITDRTDAVTAERDRATSAEQTLQTNINNEATARADAITAEATARADADTALSDRLNTLEGNTETEGSLEAQKAYLKSYIANSVLRPKTEGIGGGLTVSGNTVTVSNKIADGLNGIIFSEVIIYAGDENSEAVACHVSSVAGSEITLNTAVDNEFDGLKCKVSYMYRIGDQDGAGDSISGEGGAGE